MNKLLWQPQTDEDLSWLNNPKKLILKDESRRTKKGKMNETKIRTLLALLSHNF